MMFQDNALWPHLGVFDSIAYGLRTKNITDIDIPQRVDRVVLLIEIPIESSIASPPTCQAISNRALPLCALVELRGLEGGY